MEIQLKMEPGDELDLTEEELEELGRKLSSQMVDLIGAPMAQIAAKPKVVAQEVQPKVKAKR